MTIGENIEAVPSGIRAPRTCKKVNALLYGVVEGERKDALHVEGYTKIPEELKGDLQEGESVWFPKGYEYGQGGLESPQMSLLCKVFIEAAIAEVRHGDKLPEEFVDMREARFTDDNGNHWLGVVSKEKLSASLSKDLITAVKEIGKQLFSGWKVSEESPGQVVKECPIMDESLPHSQNLALQSSLLMAWQRVHEVMLGASYMDMEDGSGRIVADRGAFEEIVVSEGLKPEQVFMDYSAGRAKA